MRLHMASPKIILAIALAAWMPSLALAMTPSQVYESVKDSVVVVEVYDRQGKQTGLASGVMLPSSDIITNYHIVKAGVRFTVGRGKQVSPATLKAGDPEMDLCLLTAPGLEAKPARLGKAGELKVGEPVYAVGAPEGLELSLSEGIVSQLRGGPPPLIQTTVAISPGSSGGGLFNAEGELVGITTFYLKEGQNLNFALPVEWIAEAAGKKIAVPAAVQPRWALYFSPQGGCTEAIVTAVGLARKSLHIEAYIFTSQPILQAVIAAQNRGVEVAVILDAAGAEDKFSVLHSLLAAQVPTWIDSAYKIAHNKIMIIDGETVLTGSFDFTRSAEKDNAENLLVIRDQALAAHYEANFQEHLRHSQRWGPGQ